MERESSVKALTVMEKRREGGKKCLENGKGIGRIDKMECEKKVEKRRDNSKREG